MDVLNKEIVVDSRNDFNNEFTQEVYERGLHWTWMKDKSWFETAKIYVSISLVYRFECKHDLSR